MAKEKLKKNELVDKKVLKEYSDLNAEQEIIGCILKDPKKMKESDCDLSVDDFGGAINKVIFTVVHDMYFDGAEDFPPDVVEKYLDSFPLQKAVYDSSNGGQYIKNSKYVSNVENFSFNYKLLKKYALFRKLVELGVNVKEYCDPFETDNKIVEEKRKLIRDTDINEIINHYKNKIIMVGNRFVTDKEDQEIRAGEDGFLDLIEKWEKEPDYGLGYSCDMLTTLSHGMGPGKFVLCSASSGTGKTRLALSTIAHTFASRYYDPKTGEWRPTQTCGQVPCLYIGTEMELEKEIIPLLIAYIAFVPNEKMIQGRCTPEEKERIVTAHDILANESAIYLKYMPDYNISKLEDVISYHVSVNKVKAVFFDYIHTTPELDAEYVRTAQLANPREDQVLAAVGLKLKNLAQKLNIFIHSATQTSGGRSEIIEKRDASCIRGSKALADKADLCYIVTPIVENDKEWGRLTKIEHHSVNFEENRGPNLCIAVYKNRSGISNRNLWVKFDYPTLRMHDLFATNREYSLLEVDQTRITIDENGLIKIVGDDEIIHDREGLAQEIERQKKIDALKQKQKDDELLAKVGSPGSLFNDSKYVIGDDANSEYSYKEHKKYADDDEYGGIDF